MDSENEKPKHIVEKWVRSRWIRVASLQKLKHGDIFRMFEPDGTPVKDPQGQAKWMVTREIYPEDPEGTSVHCTSIRSTENI